MILHRSINEYEFFQLLSGQNVVGAYNIDDERQSTFNSGTGTRVVSFYVDDFWWIDRKHKICLIADIPENRLRFGIGTYYASKNLPKTHIWSGRRGSAEYKINEAYTTEYNIRDVKQISLPLHTERYLNEYRKTLQQYNVGIMERPDVLLSHRR